jgi:hypothetical protein
MDCPKRSRHGSPRGLFLEALSRYRSTQAARAAVEVKFTGTLSCSCLEFRLQSASFPLAHLGG